MQHDPEVGRKRRSDAGPFPPCSNASYVINILPLKTKIKHKVPCSPSRHCPFELEITFCVRGVTTDPCGVPVSVSDHLPSSSTPDLSHFWIRRRMRRSATRCSMNRITHVLSRLSKKLWISASST